MGMLSYVRYHCVSRALLFLVALDSSRCFVPSSQSLSSHSLSSSRRCTSGIFRRSRAGTSHATRLNDAVTLEDIERVFCISDLHTDHTDNMKWLAEKVPSSPHKLGEKDLIVVAGDISHDMDNIDRSLSLLKQQDSQILFVCGNHEAWLKSTEKEKQSLEKFEAIYQLCRDMDVLTEPTLVTGDYPLEILPLDSWYDGTLSLEGCEDLCRDFAKWPWVDFARTKWPFPRYGDAARGRIPDGLTEYLLEHNPQPTTSAKHLMTVSHFLPNQQCLPDWNDLDETVFQREEWLNHGAPHISAKFAKVAGSKLIDDQIRSFPSKRRRIHVFGHSHRPKDFEYKGIRYIHNPLGKPLERKLHMVSPKVDFQLVWDTRVGEIAGDTILRYWEQYAGGVEALGRRMEEHRPLRRRSRYYTQNKTTKDK